jgi:hypothetical protein
LPRPRRDAGDDEVDRLHVDAAAVMQRAALTVVKGADVGVVEAAVVVDLVADWIW